MRGLLNGDRLHPGQMRILFPFLLSDGWGSWLRWGDAGRRDGRHERPRMIRRHDRRRSGAWLAASVAAWTAVAAPAQPPRDVARWTVTPSKDGEGCFLTRTFDRPGGTTLLLGLDRNGANHLSVLNANWSIRPRQELKLDFRLSNGSYLRHFAVGMTADGKQGFVAGFETRFPAYFAASAFLHIARGDTPVERLALDGSGAAVAELRDCVAARRRQPAEPRSGKDRGDDIPRDPFARARADKPD